MTKAAIDFNLKYGLNVSPSSFETVKQTSTANDIAGKPRKNIIEVLKRFFKNPVAVVALVIFITVIICSIVIPHTSPYTSTGSVVTSGDIKVLTYAHSLPPQGSVVTTAVSTSQYNDMVAIQNIPNSNFKFDVVESFPSFQTYVVKYDPWKFLQSYQAVATHVSSTGSHHSIVGTNGQGVDIWTRTWFGTSRSLLLALVVSITTLIIGLFVGGFIGLYAGSIIDILVNKILSVYSAVPNIVWYIVIQAFLPPGFWSLYIVFIVTGWMGMVGTTRFYMWRYINADFMKAAKTLGVSKIGLIFKHALPNFLGVILLGFVSMIPGVIEGEASLGFIGFSPDPNGATLGNVLNEMKETVASGQVNNVAYLLLPTLIIFTITMSLHFVALGLTDAVDPKFRKR